MKIIIAEPVGILSKAYDDAKHPRGVGGRFTLTDKQSSKKKNKHLTESSSAGFSAVGGLASAGLYGAWHAHRKMKGLETGVLDLASDIPNHRRLLFGAVGGAGAVGAGLAHYATVRNYQDAEHQPKTKRQAALQTAGNAVGIAGAGVLGAGYTKAAGSAAQFIPAVRRLKYSKAAATGLAGAAGLWTAYVEHRKQQRQRAGVFTAASQKPVQKSMPVFAFPLEKGCFR